MHRDLLGDLGRHAAAAGVDIADGVDQLLSQAALEQVRRRARLHGLERLRVAVVGGEHHDPGVGRLGAYGLDGLQSGQARHLQIHQDHVRLQRAKPLDGFGAVLGLADEPHVVLPLQHRRHTLPEDRVVVDDEDRDGSCRIAHLHPGPPAAAVRNLSTSPRHSPRASSPGGSRVMTLRPKSRASME